MKNSLVLLFAIIIVAVGAYFGWQFLYKKSPEGQSCKSDQSCQQGLRCITNICSSGKTGSPCLVRGDCSTSFCVSNKCTEGLEGNPCNVGQDCQQISLCKKSICVGISEQPNAQVFNEYFSDMGLGLLPAGGKVPMDVQKDVDVFQKTDNLCLYGDVIKQAGVGSGIYSPTEKKFVVEKRNYPQSLKPGGFDGCSQINLPAGKYEYKIYTENILVGLFPFKVR